MFRPHLHLLLVRDVRLVALAIHAPEADGAAARAGEASALGTADAKGRLIDVVVAVAANAPHSGAQVLGGAVLGAGRGELDRLAPTDPTASHVVNELGQFGGGDGGNVLRFI